MPVIHYALRLPSVTLTHLVMMMMVMVVVWVNMAGVMTCGEWWWYDACWVTPTPGVRCAWPVLFIAVRRIPHTCITIVRACPRYWRIIDDDEGNDVWWWWLWHWAFTITCDIAWRVTPCWCSVTVEAQTVITGITVLPAIYLPRYTSLTFIVWIVIVVAWPMVVMSGDDGGGWLS